jgi:hypothetical protein
MATADKPQLHFSATAGGGLVRTEKWRPGGGSAVEAGEGAGEAPSALDPPRPVGLAALAPLGALGTVGGVGPLAAEVTPER